MRDGQKPYDWASEFDADFARHLGNGDLAALSDRARMGQFLDLAHPTVDHYLSALTVAGAAHDELLFMNESIDIASVSMRSFVLY